MVDSLTPDGLAEAIERARFSLLRQGRWEELREGERTTRIEILRNALDTSGVTVRLQALELRAGQTSELADLLERREADFQRRLADDDAEIVRLSEKISTLTAELATVTAERDTAQAEAADGCRRLTAIREVLDEETPSAEVVPEIPTQSTAPAVPAPSPAKSRAPRSQRRGTKARQSTPTGH